jgi:hypothetical protein
MTINSNYEVSSEGAVRHWEIPYASLVNATPTETEAAEVLGTAGSQLNGTVLTIDATDSIAVIDFTPGMVYRHNVRTVLTYNGGVENTWGTLDIGDAVYYDDSATMPAGCYLSTSPLNNLGTANTLFGWVVPADENDTFPKAAGAAGNTWEQAVMQHGA